MITSTPQSPKPPTPLKVLLMGPPGSRKTWLGLQFPEVHVLDCDRNLDGPERCIREGIKDLKGQVVVEPANPNLTYTLDPIRYKPDGTMRESHDCLNSLNDILKLMTTDASYKSRKTVMVDSLSHVNEFIIRHVLKMQNKTKNIGDMEARDWGPFKSQAYQFLVSKLEEINKTVICTCHEIKLLTPDKNDMMNPTVTGIEPFFQGKVGDTIGAFFTDVWRCDLRQASAGKYELFLQTIRTPKCEHLKNSLGLPGEIDITKGFKVLEPYLKGKI